MRYTILALILLLYNSCNESNRTERNFFSSSDISGVNYNTNGVNITDSAFIHLFLTGQYARISNGSLNLNNDLKIGLYTVSLLNQGRYKEARKYIQNAEKLLSVDRDNGIAVPVFEQEKVDFYSWYATYKYLQMGCGFSPPDMLDFVKLNLRKLVLEEQDIPGKYLYNVEALALAGQLPHGYDGPPDPTHYDMMSGCEAYPTYVFAQAQVAYSRDSFLNNYARSLQRLSTMGFQKAYNMRLLMSVNFDPFKDSMLFVQIFHEFNDSYPNLCDENAIGFQYFYEKSYDSTLYKRCLNCIESGMQRYQAHGRVYLSYYYLRNQQFEKVDSLVSEFKSRIKGKSLAMLDLVPWELVHYYTIEMAVPFLQKDFEKFRQVAASLESNQRFRTDYGNNPKAYGKLIEYFYRKFVNEDMQGFPSFLQQNHLSED